MMPSIHYTARVGAFLDILHKSLYSTEACLLSHACMAFELQKSTKTMHLTSLTYLKKVTNVTKMTKKNKSDKNDRSDRSDGMEQEKGSKSGESTGLYKDEQRTRKVVESDGFERPVSTYSMHAHFHKYSSCGIGTTVQMDGKVDLQR